MRQIADDKRLSADVEAQAPVQAAAALRSVIRAYHDELEREHASERVYDTMQRKARAGYVTGGRKYGYTNVPVDGHVERRINPAEAAVIGRIFELFAAGSSSRQIAKQLNAAGVPGPRSRARPGARECGRAPPVPRTRH